jgi:hypothetical protein
VATNAAPESSRGLNFMRGPTFIDARIVTISAQISGTIRDVAVTDNEAVDAGTVLVRMDPRIYQAQHDQAKAQVDQSNANISNLDAQIDAQQARISQANTSNGYNASSAMRLLPRTGRDVGALDAPWSGGPTHSTRISFLFWSSALFSVPCNSISYAQHKVCGYKKFNFHFTGL